MNYFPSADKLFSLGFSEREEHHEDFTNWTKHIDGNRYYRITRRKVVIEPTEEIRLQEISGHKSYGAHRKKQNFQGYFPSEAFFDELLIAAGWVPTKNKYVPSPEKLASIRFYPSPLSTSRDSCWYRKMSERGWGHHLTIDSAGRVVFEEMSFGTVNYPRFIGVLPSEEFFDELLKCFEGNDVV